MKKLGLLSAVLATVLFASNAFSIDFKTSVTVKNTIDQGVFGSEQDIWVHFDTFSSKCLHKCSYHRIKPGDSYTPSSSFLGSKLTVVTYVQKNGKNQRLKQSFDITKDQVEVSLIKNDQKKSFFGSEPTEYKLAVKETGKVWTLSLTPQEAQGHID